MSPATPFIPDTYWRSLAVFNLFRVTVAIGTMLAGFVVSDRLFAYQEERDLYYTLTSVYLALTILHSITVRFRRPNFRIQLTFHMASDIGFIVGLMHISGGLKTGIGLMLLPYLAVGGLISRGRTTLFHAALASIALLLQQSYHFFIQDGGSGDFPQAAMLSIACFAVAWLAHRLSSYATESEQLAEKRGIDLANMSQVNQLVLQDVSDGVIVIDDQGTIRQSNQQAERLFGPGILAGKTLLVEYAPTLALAVAYWRAGAVVEATQPVASADSRLAARPRFVPIRTARAEGGVVIFLEDMERVRREAQQLKLAALGRLTANIAHEIRNPLGAIGHAAQLLAEETTDPTSRRLVEIITSNTRRLNHMVQEVLELNRRDRVQPVEIRLKDWLDQFVAEFRDVENIQTTVPLNCPESVVVRFDTGHLHQVLWNLCRNAWRHGRKQEDSLRLTVCRYYDVWALEVADDGPGVSPELERQLFEPFFTTEAQGTGLGLYIAREICAANHAVLEYVPPPAGGAVFRVTFDFNS